MYNINSYIRKGNVYEFISLNYIGNVAVLGHLGSGKTSIIEAMAKRAGISQQIGTISQGTTISDYDVEEIKRQSSINLSLIPLEWDHCKINLLDSLYLKGEE